MDDGQWTMDDGHEYEDDHWLMNGGSWLIMIVACWWMIGMIWVLMMKEMKLNKMMKMTCKVMMMEHSWCWMIVMILQSDSGAWACSSCSDLPQGLKHNIEETTRRCQRPTVVTPSEWDLAFFFAQLKGYGSMRFSVFWFFRIAVMRWDVSGIGHKEWACVNDMFYIFTSLFFHQRLLV